MAFHQAAAFGSDTVAGYVLVEGPILLIGTDLHESTPKTRAGHRVIWLDARTVRLLEDHRQVQDLERQYAGEACQDHDLIFCREDGSPWRPDVVYRRFRAIARRAGLPPIKLHEGRHSAVSLQYGANVDPELTQRSVGHARPDMTRHYTHPEAQLFRAAAEDTAAQVDGAP